MKYIQVICSSNDVNDESWMLYYCSKLVCLAVVDVFEY